MERQKIPGAGILRRGAALLLAAAALLTSAAAVTSEKNFDEKSFLTELSAAKIGDTVFFGKYEQGNDASDGKETIAWIVLDKKDDRVLLLSEKSLDFLPMDSRTPSWYEYSRSGAPSSFYWEMTELRQWLNDDFLTETFTAAERAVLAETVVRNPGNEYGWFSGGDTLDWVFLLSKEETAAYLGTGTARIADATDYAASLAYGESDNAYDPAEKNRLDIEFGWWLRELEIENYFLTVEPDGNIGDDYSFGKRMVRPAVWVGLTKAARTASETPVKRWNFAAELSEEPCAADLKKFTDEVTYPQNGSYLLYYDYKRIQSEKGNAVYCYWKPIASKQYRRRFTVAEGTEVYVAARENGLSLVLYTEEVAGEQIVRVCWVNSKRLVSTF